MYATNMVDSRRFGALMGGFSKSSDYRQNRKHRRVRSREP
jgi:hypothetical protein